MLKPEEIDLIQRCSDGECSQAEIIKLQILLDRSVEARDCAAQIRSLHTLIGKLEAAKPPDGLRSQILASIRDQAHGDTAIGQRSEKQQRRPSGSIPQRPQGLAPEKHETRLEVSPGLLPKKAGRRSYLAMAALFLLAVVAAVYFFPQTHQISPEEAVGTMGGVERTQTFHSRDGTFLDGERQRELLYRLYYPETLAGRLPLVIFSHGLGGSREAAPFLGRHLAENGYLALHIQHPGSDESVWKGALTRIGARLSLLNSIRNPRNALDRFRDVPFVIDELEKWNQEGPLQGHIDLDRLGIAGHSYGARSVLAAAGELLGPTRISFRDPRIKAGVALSPNLAQNSQDPRAALAKIEIPLFHITGTLDESPLPAERDMDPEQRTRPYQLIDTGDQYLFVLENADHATFAGRRLSTSEEKPLDRQHIEQLERGILLFFNAYLRNDLEARNALRATFHQRLAPGDRFEWK